MRSRLASAALAALLIPFFYPVESAARRGGKDRAQKARPHGGKAGGKAVGHAHVRYVGPHPRSGDAADGFCHLEVAHVHLVAPPAQVRAMYRMRGDHYHFVADPQPFDYDGHVHAYYGHHPIAVDVVVGAEARFQAGQSLEFCYLDGAHSHHFAPQAGLNFEVKGDAHWYIGAMPDAYLEARARFVPVNEIYASLEYHPPVVVVEAPPRGYVGAFVDIHAGVGVGVGGHAHGSVEAHAPTVDIDVALPSVHVEGGVHGHASADARSSLKTKTRVETGTSFKAKTRTRTRIKAKGGAKAKGSTSAKASWQAKRGWK